MPKNDVTRDDCMLSPSGDKAGVALQLGRYVTGLDACSIDADSQESVLRCTLDALASAGAALNEPGVKAARQAALALYGRGGAPVWFTGGSVAEAAALYANSAAASALDLDDGHRRARGHPGAAIIPAALGLIHGRTNITVQEFMAAVVAGYEVGIRLAMARPAYAPSGTWSGFAVVATAGRLLGADERVIAHALGIAAQTAPAMPVPSGLAGSDVKEGIPSGAAIGLTALRLAMNGFSGPVSVLDESRLFDADVALRGLGGQPLINDTYFKLFGCCRHIHAPLEALLHLRAAHGFDVRDIAKIEVHTYQASFNLANKTHPCSLVEAQYSIPYCLALCARYGGDALQPLHPRHLDDADVADLAALIQVLHDDEIESLFPARSPARVVVTLLNGQRLASPLTDPRGDPARPLSWGELERKLNISTQAVLSPGQQQAVLDGMDGLRNRVWKPLLSAVGGA